MRRPEDASDDFEGGDLGFGDLAGTSNSSGGVTVPDKETCCSATDSKDNAQTSLPRFTRPLA